MIIACPACATRYAVPDSSIGADGRTVRCAKCRHSWFQEGPELETADAAAPAVAQASMATAPVAPPPPAPVPRREQAEVPPAPANAQPEPAAADIPPAPAAEQPAPRPTGARTRARPARYDDVADGRYADEGASQFDFAPPFRPRRNWARLGMAAAVVFAVVTLGAAAAVTWAGLPDWVPVARPTFAEAQKDLVLDFPPKRQDRRTLPNGTEYFGASGTISNVGSESHTVPTILIVLRDARDRIVYSWEVVPPKRQLAPGESVTINEAVTDIPKSAKSAEIGWKPA